MTMRAKGVAVMVVQLAVVMSIAAKYAWERAHCPRVWTRTMQYDPERVIRGRYLSLTLRADACGLPGGEVIPRRVEYVNNEWRTLGYREWKVVPAVRDGKLVPRLAKEDRPEATMQLVASYADPCEFGRLSEPVEFFVPEHANGPFPLKPGEELWAEVTVPPSGPPRPVRLAVSDGKSWRVLDLR